MEQSIWISLVHNAALLLALSLVYELSFMLPARLARGRNVAIGLLISAICAAVMFLPVTIAPGLIFDTRSIILSVTAFAFGLAPTAIAAVAATLFRIIIGGQGTLVGILTIFSSALIGLIWRRFFPCENGGGRRCWLNVLAMGLVVHTLMMGAMTLYPYPLNQEILRHVALPVMLVFPIASVLLSQLLLRQQRLKSIQAELAQSEQRFRVLYDKAPVGYQSLDSEGRILHVNQRWLEMLGYTQEQVIGRWYGEFLTPECADTFHSAFQTFKETGTVLAEHRMLHKNGKTLFVMCQGKIGYDKDGNFQQTHCILQDVTLQWAMEEKLRASEEISRRLFETMAQGVVYLSPDGTIISANPAAERILEQPSGSLLGKKAIHPSWQTIAEDGRPLTGSEYPALRALETGKPVGPLTMGIRKEGWMDYTWLSINAIPLFRQGEDRPYQVYATFQDITAQRRNSRNYQLLFREMVDAFALHEIILDEENRPVDYRFLAVNPSFERMTGLKSEDILGKTVKEVLPDVESHWIERYGATVLSGHPTRFSSYAVPQDKYFEVSAYRPAPGQFACTFSDITQRIRAEAETEALLSRLKGLLENSPSPIVIMDEDSKLIELSSAEEEVIQALLPAISRKMALLPTEASDSGMVLEGLDVIETKDGKQYYESRLFPIEAPKNQKRLFAYLAVSVTQRIQAEQALKASEDKYFSYIQNAPFGVFIIDARGRFLEVNSYATFMTGFSQAQLLKRSILDIAPKAGHQAVRDSLEALKKNGRITVDLQYIHQDGSLRWWAVDAVELSEGRYISFQIDITAKKQAEARLHYLVTHDHLTGLYNRRYFEETLSRLDREDQLPLTIMIGDINGVKLVNDAFGHAEGDRLIIDCMQIVAGCLRPGDTFARTGGDEFGILMPKTDHQTASQVLIRIQEALAQFDQDQKNARYVHSISLGLASRTSMEEEIGDVSKIAEDYMYQRKLLDHNSSHSAIIASIKATMNETSHETGEHTERMVALSEKIADRLRLSQIERDRLVLLAMLHDIGKISISPRILSKPGELSPHEWVEMKRHPEIGYRIANSTPDLIPIAECILSHHERWDGEGYPRGIQGKNIPLLARILAVVDAYDAMTENRPYRKAKTHDEAIAEIKRCAGTQFDPHIVRTLVSVLTEEDAQLS